jgi:hypothetical protein
MKNLCIVIFALMIHVGNVKAQELNCQVIVNSSALKSTTAGDAQVFTDLQLAVQNFLNNQRWTNDNYTEKEKIKCKLVINLLNAKGQYAYSGNALFQVQRPIYGTNEETTLLQFTDLDFVFSFMPEERNMIFNEQSFSSNLSSMLAFYSLTALTLDYDSFSKLGGNPFIERLFNVVNLASGGKSQSPWGRESELRSRYWLMENLRNQQYTVFREGYYNYHRFILDDFTRNPEQHRRNLIEYLNTIKVLNNQRPNAIILRNFFDAKYIELINIFSGSSKEEKKEAFNLLSKLDPIKSDKYRKILK